MRKRGIGKVRSVGVRRRKAATQVGRRVAAVRRRWRLAHRAEVARRSRYAKRYAMRNANALRLQHKAYARLRKLLGNRVFKRG